MNLREAQALVMLFQACQNEAVRKRAVELVPDLVDWCTGIAATPEVFENGNSIWRQIGPGLYEVSPRKS